MATSDAIRAECVLPLKTASSDLSQSTFADMVDVDTTPPTSSSGLSSQEIVPHIGESHAPMKSLGAAPADIYTQRIQPPPLTYVEVNSGVAPKSRSNSPSKGGPENAVVQGQKRTASGEIKQSNVLGSRNPGTDGLRGHARTTSTASNGNKIAELSSQLRARLSYAASIVEKNRQSRDANGEEGASTRHSESPARSISSSRDLGHIYLSPRNEASRSQMHYLHGSPEKTPSYASDLASPKKPRSLNGPARISSSTSADIASLTRSSSQPEQNNTFPGEIPNLNKHQRRTLAPPADIVTGENKARRRPNPNMNVPTSWPNISPNHQKQSSQQGRHNRTSSMKSIVPGTPPYNLQPSSNPPHSTPAAVSAKARTPSQNAIMEQDAIETLLFMSSPGNSGYHPSTSSQHSQHSQPQQQSQQQQQQLQKRAHNTLNHAVSSSMPAPRSNHETQVGLGIDGAPGLDPHRTPTQTTQGQRPVRRVSFLDNDSAGGETHSELDFQPTHGVGFRFEDQAGDEIDRLLDQMVEEDSDDSDDNFIRNSHAWLQGGKGGISSN